MSKHLTPKSWWTKLWAGELPFELLLGIGTVAGLSLTGIVRVLSNPLDGVAVSYFLLAGFMLFIFVWRAIARYRRAQDNDGLHALDGAMHALHAVLTEYQTPAVADEGVRVCIFVPFNGTVN